MIFTVKNCKVEITFLFLATLTFSFLIDRFGIAGVGFLATIIHESGHLLLMYLLKFPPSEIKLKPFGIDIVERSEKKIGYGKDALISIAGPFMNLLFFLLSGWLAINSGSLYLFYLSASNLVLAIFNLLPIETLDGGQAIYSLLCLKFQEKTVERIIRILSVSVLLPLFITALLVLFRSKYNFTLLFVSIYLFFLFFMKDGKRFIRIK